MKFLFTLCASLILFSEEVILPLGDPGFIRYHIEDKLLIQIDRLSLEGQVMYTHKYHYNSAGCVVSEDLIGELGTIFYLENCVVQSPYTYEKCEFDEQNHLIKHTKDDQTKEYEYDDAGRLIYPSIYPNHGYNQQGNLEYCEDFLYEYDEKGRLVSVITQTGNVVYEYDEQDRRVSRSCNGVKENYVMLGLNEIAILDEEGCLKQLRIPGLSAHKDIIKSIAIETTNGIYCPFHDRQGNITKLINIQTKESISLKKADPYGRGLSKDIPVPWIFSYKHYDPQTDLVYFGHRFYSPALGKWLTPDPAHQTDDPYQYCLYNPLMNFDPDGRFAITLFSGYFGVGAAVFTCPLWGSYGAAACVGALIGYGGYKSYEYLKEMFSKEQAPPFNGKDLGDNSSVCPVEGFVWKGRGTPQSGRGAWVNPSTKESLHPDFNHAGDVGPHWDYVGSDGKEARIYVDGSWEWK